MHRLLSIIFLLIFLNLHAFNLVENGSDFAAHQETLSRIEVQNKLKTALQKHPDASNWYKIDEDKLEILGFNEATGKQEVEFTFFFGSKSKPTSQKKKVTSKQKPLMGYRIALDPGHMGGDLADLEERYIRMPPNPKYGIEHTIEFNEGSLAMQTTLKLKEKLENLGAEVFITKTQVSKGVLTKDFDSWMKEDFSKTLEQMVAFHTDPKQKQLEQKYWENQATPSQIFRTTYGFIDLIERAQKINAFQPDVTISIHYNLGYIYDKQGHTPGTEDDYTLFFVPGAFLKPKSKGEAIIKSSLDHASVRYEFVRLLVSDDIDQSVRLAQITQKRAYETLKLPPGDHCSYLKVLCLKHSNGIYHRNLTLTRFVHGPLLYCEPFCQDNFSQAKILDENPELRINQMVEIYTQSLIDFFNENNHSSLNG